MDYKIQMLQQIKKIKQLTHLAFIRNTSSSLL
jgi:hypothetical protein